MTNSSNNMNQSQSWFQVLYEGEESIEEVIIITDKVSIKDLRTQLENSLLQNTEEIRLDFEEHSLLSEMLFNKVRIISNGALNIYFEGQEDESEIVIESSKSSLIEFIYQLKQAEQLDAEKIEYQVDFEYGAISDFPIKFIRFTDKPLELQDLGIGPTKAEKIGCSLILYSLLIIFVLWIILQIYQFI